MTVSQRFDSSPLRRDAIQRTPQGGLRVPAALTRSGCAPYSDGDGSWIEYRPADEVARAESLATLQSAPVTDDHPTADVTPDNWAALSKGFVEGLPRYDDQTGLVLASVLVQDGEECRLVESGERVELSCGYQCDVDPTPGTAPDGTRYDRVQRNIKYNHVALGPRGWGRMGPQIRLRVDGAAHRVDVSTPKNLMEKKLKITVGKREFRLDADEIAAAQQAVDEEMKKADMDSEMLAAVKAALEQALAKIKELEEKMGSMVPSTAVEAEVQALDSVRADARKALGDSQVSGKSKRDLQCLVIEKAFPGRRFDAGDVSLVDAMFPLAVEVCTLKGEREALSDQMVGDLRHGISKRDGAVETDDESPLDRLNRATRERFQKAFSR